MAITLAQLRQQSRERADMVGSEFVSDTELNTYINASIAELHDLLIQSYGSDYYVSTDTFATVANTDSYALPDDFYKLMGVDIQISGQEFTSLQRFNFNDRNQYRQATVWNLNDVPGIRYRLVGANLMLSPTPDSANNIKIWYVPVATVLAADGDELADFNQFAEYVIVDAAIKMMQKEESDVSVLFAQKKALIKRLEQVSQNRDAGEAESISDVYTLDSRWYRD